MVQDVTQASRCAESPRISGDVNVANQSELDALQGCEEITGSLNILTFEGADLAPLASLRVVGEALFLGAQQEDPVSDDPEEQLLASEQYQALQEVGFLESLNGLQALESVDRLYLTGVLVADLTGLTSLRSISSGMVVSSSKNLRDLSGLEAATAIPTVWVADCVAITSLTGLELDTSRHSIILEQLPALTNIDALADILSFDALIIDGTGLEALPNFSYFAAFDIRISGNPALSDVSGLGQLGGARTLSLIGNSSLRALPALSELGWLETLVVAYNDALEELTLDFPALQPPSFDATGPRQFQLSADSVEIGNNASLRRITSPASFSAVQFFNVFSNPSLTELDLGTLERTDLLSIDDNAALASVAAPSLATADALEVTNNPLLVPSAFDNVKSFTRLVSGNAVQNTEP